MLQRTTRVQQRRPSLIREVTASGTVGPNEAGRAYDASVAGEAPTAPATIDRTDNHSAHQQAGDREPKGMIGDATGGMSADPAQAKGVWP